MAYAFLATQKKKNRLQFHGIYSRYDNENFYRHQYLRHSSLFTSSTSEKKPNTRGKKSRIDHVA